MTQDRMREIEDRDLEEDVEIARQIRERASRGDAAPAPSREATLADMLLESNEVLRSCHEVAQRDGGATNWPALRNRINAVLVRQHKATNALRAGDAPAAPATDRLTVLEQAREEFANKGDDGFAAWLAREIAACRRASPAGASPDPGVRR